MKNKTLTAKIVFAAIAGLLVTSASAIAQVAPPTPASVAPNYSIGNETSLIMPKPRSNLFLDAGFQYLQTDLTNDGYKWGSYNFYGANAVFGWRINIYNKIQIEIAGLGSYKDHRYGDKETWVIVPELFTYSFCVPLDTHERWELRLSPSVGFSYIFARFDYGNSWESDSSTLCFTYGAGIGITCHVSKRMYLDAGYRYLRVSGPALSIPYFGDIIFDDMDTHGFTVACGWKF